MPNLEVRAHLQAREFSRDHDLYVEVEQRGGAVLRLVGLKLEQADPSAFYNPLTERDMGFPIRNLVQAIMDAGWAAGFRPAGFHDLPLETAAVRAHLKDMRAIAFAKLRVVSP